MLNIAKKVFYRDILSILNGTSQFLSSRILGILFFAVSFWGNGQCDSFDGILSVSTSGFTATSGYTQEYVLVDNLGVIIAINGSGNFVGLNDGNYTVYAVNYEGATPLPLTIGNFWSLVDSYDQNPLNCFHSISNNYTVCSTTQLCDGVPINVSTNNFHVALGYQQLYILVDQASGNILEANSTGTFNQSSYGGPGTFEIYAVNTNDPALITLLNGNGPWNTALISISSSCADVIGPKFFTILNCCDLIISGTASNETCAQNDGSINLTIVGSASYDVLLNSVLYPLLDDVMAGTYNLPNLSDGNYELIVFDSTDPSCNDTLNLTINEGGTNFSLSESVETCSNTSVTYPDGTSEVITVNTSHTSNLLTTNGCDSIIVTNVTVLPILTNSVNESICFGTQFTSPQGNNYGAGAHDETYLSASGCDSIVTFIVTALPEITSTVNESICFGTQFNSPQGNNYGAGSHDETYLSASGCDSIVTFIVTALPEITNTVNESICFGTQFTSPQGNNYGAGAHDETYLSASGCDSIVTFIVTELPEITSTMNESICFGAQFTSPQGNNYGAGTHDETYLSASGCDSIVTFIVTELPEITNTVNESICFGTQFNSPQGNNYGAGTHDEIYLSASGCDSIVTFFVTELPEITNTVNESICFGTQFTSPQGNNYGAGSHDETYLSASGCDSVVTFIVTEVVSITNTVNASICSGAQFTSPSGNLYGVGSFDETFTSNSGCDSIVTYLIVEITILTNSVNEAICFGAQFTSPQGNNYGAGTFDETYTSATGCDSIVTYIVTELPAITTTDNQQVCAGAQFLSPLGNSYGVGMFDETYTSISGCDSVVTFVITELPHISNSINETVCFGAQFTSPQGNSYGAGAFDEIYTSASGCDSVVTYIITELPLISNAINQTICFGTQFTSPQGNSYGAGIFDETYTSSSGCDSVVTYIITEQTAITNTINITICENDQYISPQGNSYGPGSFDEIYTSVLGCDSLVTFIVTEQPTITSTVNASVCFGEMFISPQGSIYGVGSHDEVYASALGCDSSVTYIVTELPAITGSISEAICTGSFFISDQGNVYSAGTYTETYVATNGCDSTVTLTISEYDPVLANFNFNEFGLTSLNTEVQFNNTSQNAQYYTWDFGDGSMFSTEDSPIHEYPVFESGSYTVTLIASNAVGCSDTSIQGIFVQEELIFFVPNTFTPDGDQFNQYFQPVFTSGFDPFDYQLLIYNRWGQLIFNSNNPEIGWDGTFKGVYVQDGTYVWKLEFKTVHNDERHIEVGHVNMLK